ncbi:hypothetical protein [Hymenobacter cellulosivorans]|uniref:Uncharacterized protein n=1 Tax=Hymenobacter cellulosivorans TaxID=2932249 RepID=A0ABY4F3F1_9BACT|nr:hypothetical protein [Hymenobacter cellulosivorans]UOQ50697.1 hypothetical protein MUN80_13100 [Hymenobacter cellulosivorans]
MSDTLHSKVLTLHRHYNQVAETQLGLPSKRSRTHDNHAAQEQRVIAKALEVSQAAHSLPVAGTEYEAEVENILDGCRQIQQNPYLRLGGIVRV